MELLLCFPSLLSSTEMTVLHVHHHHRYNDGPEDVTSTLGRERGLGAMTYWFEYGFIVKSYTFREVYRRGARRSFRRRRAQFAFDLGVCLCSVLTLLVLAPQAGFFDWLLPALLSHVTFGYFSWLTHAPARDQAGAVSSINNVDNLLNFFIFNQGFHAIHHAHPGIHWSEIPDKLGLMKEIDDSLIVPYWVSINSAWRIVAPERFRDAKFGAIWRQRLARRNEQGNVRARRLPQFVWI
ncbi:MAG TPA: fatty acid desaturase [Polyangiaceae bacterium]|nr:fatty acid desaturase [Polyangiaceae bacterium]